MGSIVAFTPALAEMLSPPTTAERRATVRLSGPDGLQVTLVSSATALPRSIEIARSIGASVTEVFSAGTPRLWPLMRAARSSRIWEVLAWRPVQPVRGASMTCSVVVTLATPGNEIPRFGTATAWSSLATSAAPVIRSSTLMVAPSAAVSPGAALMSWPSAIVGVPAATWMARRMFASASLPCWSSTVAAARKSEARLTSSSSSSSSTVPTPSPPTLTRSRSETSAAASPL